MLMVKIEKITAKSHSVFSCFVKKKNANRPPPGQFTFFITLYNLVKFDCGHHPKIQANLLIQPQEAMIHLIS